MAEEHGLVSVILPVYNGEKYVLQAVQSILTQTYDDFELIIIDNASTDTTPDIISHIQDLRIVFLRNEENVGLVDSLNRGLSVANGQYIARMDADDVSHPRRLELQVRALEKHPSVGLVGTWVEAFGAVSRQHWRELRLPQNHDHITATLFFRNCIVHPTVMFRKSVLESLAFAYDPRDSGCEDFGLWTRLIGTTKLQNLPLTLLKYRIHKSGMSFVARAGDHRRSQALKRILKEYALDSLEAEAARRLIDVVDAVGYYPYTSDPRATLQYSYQIRPILMGGSNVPIHSVKEVIERERARALIDACRTHKRLVPWVRGGHRVQIAYLLREVVSRLVSRVC